MHYGLLKATRSGWEQRLLTYRVHPLCLSSRLFIFLIIVFLFSGINALSLWGLMFSYPQCHLPRGVLVVYLLQGRCVPRWRCAGWCRCWGLLLWSSGRQGCQSSYSSGSSVASFSTSGSRQPLPSLAALRRWTTGRKQSDNSSVWQLLGQGLSHMHMCVVQFPHIHGLYPQSLLIKLYYFPKCVPLNHLSIFIFGCLF